MKYALAAFALLSVSAAQAQNTEYQKMLETMQSSTQGRVLVFAPSVFDINLANMIRQTYLDSVRRTSVKIVSIQYYNYLAKSTILSLAMVNVPVYEVQTPPADGIVIVDNLGWKGRNLGKIQNPNMQRMTPQEINAVLGWFKNVTANNRRITQYEALNRLKQVLK
ncbi:hypothetical protein [Deinococcus cavernae]|uniref:hypothetical protein n=1 Tax=Deinococcus cavernae TaxID=2320857 RepID=UPI0011C20F18|nr:hypothetical protein [Deinococcus cavernae]